MEEGGKLEEERGAGRGTGWAASVVLCHYTRSQHALYVGIWDRAWQVRAELKAIEHHAKTTACVFKSQKPNGHIIVLSFSHMHRRESIYREEETPFDWKINRFTVHRWGKNIEKKRSASIGTQMLLSRFCFSLPVFCFSFLRCREVKPSGVDTCDRKTSVRNSAKGTMGQRRSETLLGLTNFHISEVSMRLYTHTYIFVCSRTESHR